MALTVIYKPYNPKAKAYTFFSAPHGTFSITDHIIGHKTGLNRYRNIEIIQFTLSDHHRLRLVLHSNKNKKHTYTWMLNNVLLNDNLVKEEIKKEIKGFLEFNQNEDTSYQSLWETMKAVLETKTYSSKCLQKENGESSH